MLKIEITQNEVDWLNTDKRFYRIYNVGFDGVSVDTCKAKFGKMVYYLSQHVENVHGSTVIVHFNLMAFKKVAKGA